MKYVSLLLVCIFALTVGCQSAKEKAVEKVTEKMVEKSIKEKTGQDTKVDISKDNLTIKTEEGTVALNAGDNAKIPADFPKDIYLWPKSKTNMVMQAPQGITVSLETTDTIDAVVTSYKENMTKNGWKQVMNMNMNGQQMLTYNKEDRNVQLMITNQDNTTIINITTMKQ